MKKFEFEFPTLSHMNLLILKEYLLKPGFVRTKLFRNTQKAVKGSISKDIRFLVQNLKNLFL